MSSTNAGAVRAGRAFVELFVDDNALTRGLHVASKRIQDWADKARDRLKKFGTNVMKLGTVTAGLGSALLGPLLGASKQFAEYGDQFEKMSHRTGLGAEALTELGYAAEMCGSDIETVEKAVKKQQILMAAAAKGSKDAVGKFKELGLSWKELAQKSPDEQLLTLINRLHRIPGDGNRAAMTMKLFGEEGAKLMPLINAGADSINEMREEARRLGISLSGEDATAAAEFTDALTRLQKLVKGIIVQIGAALAPELTGLANWFTKTATYVVDLIKNNKELIVTIAKIAFVTAAAGAALIAVGATVIGLGSTIAALGTIVSGIFAAIAGIISFLLSPIGMVVTAVAGLTGAFLYFSGRGSQAIEWLREKFASLLGTATKTWQGIQDALAAGRLDLVFKVAWAGIRVAWTQGVHFLYEKWLWVSGTLQEVWAAAVYKIAELFVWAWAGIRQTWTEMIFSIQAIWLTFTKGFMDAWSAAYTFVAKGLAWIYAKLAGLDAAEMVRIVDEDAQTNKRQRNKDDGDAMAAAAATRDKSVAAIAADRTGTLDALKDEQIRKQGARKADHDTEIERLENNRIEAERQLNEAVREAGDVRAAMKPDEKKEKKAREGWLAAAAEEKKSKGGKGGKGGTFSAFEMSAVQGNTMEDTLENSLKQQTEAVTQLKKIRTGLEDLNTYE